MENFQRFLTKYGLALLALTILLAVSGVSEVLMTIACVATGVLIQLCIESYFFKILSMALLPSRKVDPYCRRWTAALAEGRLEG